MKLEDARRKRDEARRGREEIRREKDLARFERWVARVVKEFENLPQLKVTRTRDARVARRKPAK